MCASALSEIKFALQQEWAFFTIVSQFKFTIKVKRIYQRARLVESTRKRDVKLPTNLSESI